MLVTLMLAVKNTAAATMIIAEFTSQPTPGARRRVCGALQKCIRRIRVSGSTSQLRDWMDVGVRIDTVGITMVLRTPRRMTEMLRIAVDRPLSAAAPSGLMMNNSDDVQVAIHCQEDEDDSGSRRWYWLPQDL